jgi:hypothetical protein
VGALSTTDFGSNMRVGLVRRVEWSKLPPSLVCVTLLLLVQLDAAAAAAAAAACLVP